MSRPSVMNHKFSRVPRAEIPRSSFDRSHGYKTTFDAGYLVPVYVDEVLPGDTFNLNMTGFARMATPLKPIMDNLYMETFFFAVPNRLLWENWENFMGDSDNHVSQEYIVPNFPIPPNHSGAGSLADYFGLPVFSNGSVFCNALHFRAYNLIWNEWFRDQNLQEEVEVKTGDDDSIDNYQLLRRGKRHDYFTSALPWPQKGEAIRIPGVAGGIDGRIVPDPDTQDGLPSFINSQMNDVTYLYASATDSTPPGRNVFHTASMIPDAGNYAMKWGEPALKIEWDNTAEGELGTINDLRTAFQLQKMLERDARGGTRYTEIIQAHFGVTSPDARLQRPEFLGGGSSRINVSPVQQTAEGEQTPQGNLAAYATAQLHNHGFTKSFTEHCVIIGLVNVRADLTYQQGMNRMWFRRGRYDYFWPAFANVGEQAIFDWEIYAEDNSGDPDGPIWGYQERYAEYRYKPSQITGLFRSDAPQSLDIWHLSEDFAEEPPLNDEFIQDNPPIDRVIATQDEPHFLFDAYFSLRCARPMPLFGVPGNIDRF